MSEEIQKYRSRMEGKKLVFPFKGGDDKADYVDKDKKLWLAKKDETLEELKDRAAGKKIPSKTIKEGDEGEET